MNCKKCLAAICTRRAGDAAYGNRLLYIPAQQHIFVTNLAPADSCCFAEKGAPFEM